MDTRGASSGVKAAALDGPWQVDDLLVDAKRGRVTRDGVELALPELSLRLLLALVRHAPDRVSKDELIAEVWAGGVVSDETLTQRVSLLRQALGDRLKAPRYIASVRNVGYWLVAPVQRVEAADSRRLPGRRALALAAALLVLLLIATVQLLRTDGVDADAQRVTSIAVLPLRQVGVAPDQAHLLAGIHLELINRLSRLQGLSVVSRRSVLALNQDGLKSSQIARQLGVAHLLEGSIQVAGERLLVNVQLIDGGNDRSIWSQRYEREFNVESLFEIQSELAQSVASALQLELSGADRSSLVQLPTTDLANYERYLLGRHHLFKLRERDLATAVELLQPVVANDPDFAAAWTALGWAYAFQASGYADVTPSERYPQAIAAARRALELDPQLADAHSLYADLLTWFEWDWAAAEAQYRQTMALEPDNVAGYALYLSALQRHDQAIEQIERLTRRFPNSGYFQINAAWRYLNARRYAEALNAAQRSAGHADALSVQGWAYLGLGQPDQALAAFQRDAAMRPEEPIALSNLAIAQIRSGNPALGREQLARLEHAAARRYVPATLIAAVHFELSQPEPGFAWLQRALQARDRGVIFLQVDHALDGYRDDPRYLAVLQALGFPSVAEAAEERAH